MPTLAAVPTTSPRSGRTEARTDPARRSTIEDTASGAPSAASWSRTSSRPWSTAAITARRSGMSTNRTSTAVPTIRMAPPPNVIAAETCRDMPRARKRRAVGVRAQATTSDTSVAVVERGIV